MVGIKWFKGNVKRVMKTTDYRGIFSLLLIIAIPLALTACNPMELFYKVEARVLRVPVTGVSVTKESTAILVGNTEQLFAAVEPSDATIPDVAWTSGNEEVATVNAEGVVTGVSAGTAAITVTTADGGYTAACEVTVSVIPVPVTGLTLNKSTTSLLTGNTEQFAAVITPSNATNQNLIWSSSDTSKATVGSGGLLTGVSVGSTVITAVTADGGFTATCTVTVSSVEVHVTGVNLNKAATSIQTNGTERLTATIYPIGATNQTATWETNNASIATVDATGLVTAVAAGPATITVTTADGGKTAQCTVTVSDSAVAVTGVSLNKATTVIAMGATEQLNASIAPPDATNQNVTWSTSNPAKATVSSSGLVTGVAIGTATITVTTADIGWTDTCEVTVHAAGENIAYTLPVTSIMNMKFVPGKTFPTGTADSAQATIAKAFWMGETEVTYELWHYVRIWALFTASPAYSFANAGSEGNDGTPGAAPTAAMLEPATSMNWRDAMVWCNALTEYYNASNGTDPDLTCVYYTDGAYAAPLRASTASTTITNTTPGSQDMPYIKAAGNGNTDMANCAANGFRLPGSMEWELAARWRNDSINTVPGYSNPWFTRGNSASGAYTYYYDTADTNPWNFVVDGKDANDRVAVYYFYWNGSSWAPTGVINTAVVKSKGSIGYNSLGMYDMSGNVWEWCFTENSANRVYRGGGWINRADYLQVGNPDSNTPYFANSSVGFRVVRSAE